jgi:hypothetical protein
MILTYIDNLKRAVSDSIRSSCILSNYSTLSFDSGSYCFSKEYSKLISLISLSCDVIILKPENENFDQSISMFNQDPTLCPSFWDGLLKFYFSEIHLSSPIFSLKNFSIGNEYWIRTNIIYCTAYDLWDTKNPIASIKMKLLLKFSEYHLNRCSPSLLSLQCYLMLHVLYRGIGDLRKKRLYLHRAFKTSELIGLTKKCKGISLHAQYERYLCYTKIIEFYWCIGGNSNNMGLTLDSVDIWPEFSLDYQLVDHLHSSEEDLAIANNTNLNSRFRYLVQIYIIFPLFKLIKKDNFDISAINRLEIKLDDIFSEISKKLIIDSYQASVPNYTRVCYLTVKQQLNIVLLKDINSTQLQFKYIKLNFDIIGEYLYSNIKLPRHLIAIHTVLQSTIKLAEYIDESYFDSLSNLISLLTNILHSSKYYKIYNN